MKSLTPEGRVFGFACDGDERIIRLWGDLPSDRSLGTRPWEGERVERLLEYLDVTALPEANERYWRPHLFDRMVKSESSGTWTRLLTLPTFDEAGLVVGTVTLLFSLQGGRGFLRRPRRGERSSVLDSYLHLTPRMAGVLISLERAASYRRRLYPDAEMVTIWTDRDGKVVAGADECWFGVEQSSFHGRAWEELLGQVTQSWGTMTAEADDIGKYVRRVCRFGVGKEERVLELLVFCRSTDETPFGLEILATTTTGPARTELCLHFEERQYLGDLPTELLMSEDQAIEALRSNGGVPLVRLHVLPDDVVTSIESLDPREVPIDFGNVVGTPVAAVHGVLVSVFGSSVAMLNERVELGFRDLVLEFKRDDGKPTLVQVIELPCWAENGTVEGVKVYLGLLSDGE